MCKYMYMYVDAVQPTYIQEFLEEMYVGIGGSKRSWSRAY